MIFSREKLYNIKKKSMESNEVEKFVKAVLDKDNVKASKYLEKAMKQKVAKRLADTLKEAND